MTWITYNFHYETINVTYKICFFIISLNKPIIFYDTKKENV